MPMDTTRRLRAFRRWMSSNGIHCSDALELVDGGDSGGIFVRSRRGLKVGDLVATIPKAACLTINTSGARRLIESAALDGSLGLSVALMYEWSLGSASPWAPYLHLIPNSEPLPLLWSFAELDSFLLGTELHNTIKEDKAVIQSDWKDCILPLIPSLPPHIHPSAFSVERYFAAKSLVASRSFQIDDYYGSGMVPLADLFNHKTGAEHVHFTTTPSDYETNDDSDSEDGGDEMDVEALENGLSSSTVITTRTSPDATEDDVDVDVDVDVVVVDDDDDDVVDDPDATEDPMVLEMILVKDVQAGDEVFNTYGLMGNAALLHRYGFTEPDNVYDIVNIDLDLVSQWASCTFSARHARARMSLWRRLGSCGCITQDSEYFEISYNGEPQIELLLLLYINLLPDEACNKLDVAISTDGDSTVSPLSIHLSYAEAKISKTKASDEMSSETLLTKSVREALLSLADTRESLYGKGSLEDDVEILKNTRCMRGRKLYHSLTLRISERRILKKLRIYAKNNMPPASDRTTSGSGRSRRHEKVVSREAS